MTDESDLCGMMFVMVAAEPGLSIHRLAKDLDISLMSALRIAHLLAEDDASFGAALISLEQARPGKSLAMRASLTPAGEALAALARRTLGEDSPWKT